MRLTSTCASGKIEDQTCLQEFIADRLRCNKHVLLIGQGVNAQVGLSKESLDDRELRTNRIGKHGLERRDTKGEQLIEFLQSNNLFALNTFHK